MLSLFGSSSNLTETGRIWLKEIRGEYYVYLFLSCIVTYGKIYFFQSMVKSFQLFFNVFLVLIILSSSVTSLKNHNFSIKSVLSNTVHLGFLNWNVFLFHLPSFLICWGVELLVALSTKTRIELKSAPIFL